MNMTNPTPEALQRQEAEKRVIDAVKRLSIAIDCGMGEQHQKQKIAEIIVAYHALNALSSPSEPQPTTGDQQAEEFEGWRVFDRHDVLWSLLTCYVVESPSHDFFIKTLHRSDFLPWQLGGETCPPDQSQTELHGPARLEVIRSMPPEILHAAKGVANGK